VDADDAPPPAHLRPRAPLWFPPADGADADGLVAVGGDLWPARLLLAYDSGIFPWYDEGLPPLWWSPDPRTVIDAEGLHVSRSLARTIRRGRFAVTLDRAFDDVMRACAERPGHGTWILPEMLAAYGRLHRLGHAHSVEAWDGDALVGGLYGVHRGALFAAESMFHRATDAGKVALVAAVRSFFRAGIEVFDVQMTTPHLASLGAEELPRTEYLRRVAEVRGKHVAIAGLEIRP
jgi:leucyl/phenylalanyl-tRNA--protein transferase